MLDTRKDVIDFFEEIGFSGNGNYEVASDFGEPGYTFDVPDGDLTMVVVGDLWCRCNEVIDPEDGKPDTHDYAHHHPAEFEEMVRRGVEFVFYDEWTVVYSVQRGEDPPGSGNYPYADLAYRTQPDSYSWQMSIAYNENDGEWLTPYDDPSMWIDWAIVRSKKEIRPLRSIVMSDEKIKAAGFILWVPGSGGRHDWYPGEFETGWHEGQDDDPQQVYDAIMEAHGAEGAEVVFLVNDTGQFDMRWSAYYRIPVQEDEED